MKLKLTTQRGWLAGECRGPSALSLSEGPSWTPASGGRRTARLRLHCQHRSFTTSGPDQIRKPRESSHVPACELSAWIGEGSQRRRAAWSPPPARLLAHRRRVSLVRIRRCAQLCPCPQHRSVTACIAYSSSPSARAFARVILHAPRCTSDPNSFSFSQWEIVLGNSNQTGSAGTARYAKRLDTAHGPCCPKNAVGQAWQTLPRLGRCLNPIDDFIREERVGKAMVAMARYRAWWVKHLSNSNDFSFLSDLPEAQH